MNAYLLLANGMVFAGQSVGAEGVTVGEVVFATGMVGFEETLTDPSYYGQIITQTYPLIGNYGMNKDDMESDRIWAKGYIVREACTTPSNWRCEETLDSFLKKNNTIGKLAAQLTKAGLKVWIGAADTFRAAAIDQLKVWADRAGATMIRQEMGSDPASVAFDTLTSAKANGADVVLIDTAGRLHNKVNLMNELTKIRNVMGKVIPGAPHEVMLVLDGSTGQNAFEQARQFTQATQVTSLTITKLDGTAKGGCVVAVKIGRAHV